MDHTSGHPERTECEDGRIDPVLRAKYLDYCSARISEVFLSLTDERIYELMEQAATEAELAVGSLGFQEMMKLVTRKLHESIPLPDLETWAVEYEAEPEKYDPFLLGLWKSAEPGSADAGSV
ncbi:MAG: hypothetical protein V3U67_03210 [Gemmatimonadota bacterium]